MLAMALIVASAQVAIVVHHSTELRPEPPGHVCPICLVGSNLVGLQAGALALVVPPAIWVGRISVQSVSFHSLRSHIHHARDPPR